MGDMGDDILKSMGAGCLICWAFIWVVLVGEYCLFTVFFSAAVTFDSVLLFILISVFFMAAMWRFYKWVIDLFF